MAFWNLCNNDVRITVDEHTLGFNNYVILGISFIWTCLIFSRKLKVFFQICFVLTFHSVESTLRGFPGHLFTWWRSCNLFVPIKRAHCMEEDLVICLMNFSTFFNVIYCWGKESSSWSSATRHFLVVHWKVFVICQSWVTFPTELPWNTTGVHGNRLAVCHLCD